MLRRLRYPTQLVRRVAAAVEGRRDTVPDTEPLAARRALARYGDETALDVARLRLAAGDDSNNAWLRRRSSRRATRLTASPISRSTGAISTSSGLPKGLAMGEVLAKLLERVVDDPTLNTRERLLEQAEGLLV